MSKNVDFEIGTIVTDTFLDSVQELLTGTVQNIRLAEPQGGQTDVISLALNGDSMFDRRGSVNIEGRYCFIDATQDSNAAVPEVGTVEKNVYLATTQNGSPQQPNFTITVGTAPPASSYVKRIGQVTQNGTVLSNARMVTGVQADHEQYNHFTFRSVYDLPNEVMLTVAGQSNQDSSLGTLFDSDVSSAPTKALSILQDSGSEHLYLDTAGRVVFPDNGTGSGDAAMQFTLHGTDSVITTNVEFSSHRAGINNIFDPTFYNSNYDAGFASLSARAIDVDVENRIEISNTGVICWGDGTNPPDVCLYRRDVDELSLFPGDKFFMDYTIDAVTDDPEILTNKEYVDTEIEAVGSESRRFAFFIGR